LCYRCLITMSSAILARKHQHHYAMKSAECLASHGHVCIRYFSGTSGRSAENSIVFNRLRSHLERADVVLNGDRVNLLPGVAVRVQVIKSFEDVARVYVVHDVFECEPSFFLQELVLLGVRSDRLRAPRIARCVPIVCKRLTHSYGEQKGPGAADPGVPSQRRMLDC